MGERGGVGGGRHRGKNWDNCNRITIKNDLKKGGHKQRQEISIVCRKEP